MIVHNEERVEVIANVKNQSVFGKKIRVKFLFVLVLYIIKVL